MELLQLAALIFTIFVNLYFAILVFTRDKTSITNVFFSIIFVLIDGWAVSNYMYNRPDIAYSEIVFWMRMVFFTTSPLIYALMIFGLVYPNNKSPIKIWMVVLVSAPALVLSVFSLTDYIVKGAKINNGVAIPEFGNGIWLYLVYVLTYVTITLVVLLRKYLRLKGIQKSQLLYLFFGLILFLVPATVTNLLFVVLLNNVTLAPFGPLFSLILGFFLSFAILKHRLFDITYVSSIFLQYAVLGTYTYAFFYLVIAINNTFFGSVFSANSLVLNTLIAFGYVIAIFPLRRFIEKTVVSGFEKLSNLEYLKIQISDTLNNTPQLKFLVNSVLSLLANGFDTKGTSLLILFNESNQSKIVTYGYQLDIEELKGDIINDQSYVEEFNKINGSFIRREWELHVSTNNLLIEKIFEKTAAEVVIPIITNEKNIALLLIGAKKSEWNFTLQEIEFINGIATMFAIPLQRAMLLEDVRKFADVLQNKVDEATATLRDQKSQLEEKYQFEKDMMGIMGHELRTPMTVARGMAELLMQKLGIGQDIAKDYLKEKLEKIFSSITRESDLIQTMLSTSHIDNNKINFQIAQIDLMEMIDFAMFSFKKEAEAKGLSLTFEKPDFTIPPLKSDQSRLQEVINNLISNAIKYTNKGSVNVKLSLKDEFIYFSVKDTGIGIPQAEINNIGRKFYRIHQHLDEKKDIVRAGGTGLGLYVVKGLLEAMGGRLDVESEEGVGSTFTAVFPVTLKESDKLMITASPVDEHDMFQKLGLKQDK